MTKIMNFKFTCDTNQHERETHNILEGDEDDAKRGKNPRGTYMVGCSVYPGGSSKLQQTNRVNTHHSR